MISAIILTKDCQDTLQGTLESLLWCDEIVVIDDNSKDNTVRLAQKYRAKVYQRNLNNDFAKQRNFGITVARGDWILFVDSDEIVPNKLKKEIQRIIHDDLENRSQYLGFYIKRRDFYEGRVLCHGETANIKLLRLAKRNSKTYGLWKEPVHEYWSIEGPIGELKNYLYHVPHHNVAQFLDRINKYSSIRSKYLFDKNIHEPVYFIVVKPVGKFIYNYILLLGFLDGIPGAIVAVMMSLHSFLVRSKLWLLYHKNSNKSL